jgi:hypothetical protein
MKSLVVLWNQLAMECGEWLCIDTIRDQQTVAARSNAEGTSFLTITLPTFGKDFDRSLSDGFIAPTAFAGFHRRSGLPAFLWGFLELVFDRTSGILLDNPSPDAVLAVRQLTGVFAKILIPCSDERERDALAKFVETERILEEKTCEWTQKEYLEFSRMANLLFGRIFAGVDRMVAAGALIPKHGPGATADRLQGNEKFDMKLWTWRLEKVFPSSDYLIPSYRYQTELDDVEFVHPEAELPVRVTSVPKTLKTPRLIAIEPTCMQYAQQALSSAITELCEHDDIVQRFITFRVQEHNQFLARIGSLDGSLATLDLSEASDRVSNQLVKVMLHGYTDLSEAVQACRSLRADVPGYGVIPLTKYASMGSALTFPIESMIFLVLIFLGIQKRLGRQMNLADIVKYTGKVRAYGDDLIVPTADAVSVSDALSLYGFKVNEFKSYSKGNFRESCGKEYFRGTDVSIVKCRREFPSRGTGRDRVPVNELTGEEIHQTISLVEFRNNLYLRGFRDTASFLDIKIRKILPYFPDGKASSPGLVRVVEGPIDSYESWDTDLHVGKVKAYVPGYKYRKTVLDGTGALLKHFLKQGLEPFADKEHLERSGRPVAVKLKLRNVKPF